MPAETGPRQVILALGLEALAKIAVQFFETGLRRQGVATFFFRLHPLPRRGQRRAEPVVRLGEVRSEIRRLAILSDSGVAI